MSGALEQYNNLLNELIHTRWIYAGMECEQEDKLLEKMDEVWNELTEHEREQLQALPTRSIIRSESDRIMRDTGMSPGPRRAVFDVEEAA